jgi:hypothetical protein
LSFLIARFSLMDLPDFLLADCRGDLSDMALPGGPVAIATAAHVENQTAVDRAEDVPRPSRARTRIAGALEQPRAAVRPTVLRIIVAAPACRRAPSGEIPGGSDAATGRRRPSAWWSSRRSRPGCATVAWHRGGSPGRRALTPGCGRVGRGRWRDPAPS